jgi:hypothetical protein
MFCQHSVLKVHTHARLESAIDVGRVLFVFQLHSSAPKLDADET